MFWGALNGALGGDDSDGPSLAVAPGVVDASGAESFAVIAVDRVSRFHVADATITVRCRYHCIRYHAPGVARPAPVRRSLQDLAKRPVSVLVGRRHDRLGRHAGPRHRLAQCCVEDRQRHLVDLVKTQPLGMRPPDRARRCEQGDRVAVVRELGLELAGLAAQEMSRGAVVAPEPFLRCQHALRLLPGPGQNRDVRAQRDRLQMTQERQQRRLAAETSRGVPDGDRRPGKVGVCEGRERSRVTVTDGTVGDPEAGQLVRQGCELARVARRNLAHSLGRRCCLPADP
jgi:hypothetical protein